MAAPPNYLEPWANPPNIFGGAPVQAFMAQMGAAQGMNPQRQQPQSQSAPQDRSVPQSPLAAYAASTATGGARSPRTVRTNNPGAIEFGPFAQSAGATGSDGRYAVFPDVATGYNAMDRLLGVYAGRGQNTIASIIGGTPDNPNRAWAPRSVDNNSTDAYIASVARAVGVDPNAPIPPHLMSRVAEAMAAYEAGRPVPRY